MNIVRALLGWVRLWSFVVSPNIQVLKCLDMGTCLRRGNG